MVLEFIIHVTVTFMVLGISLFMGAIVEFKNKVKNEVAGFVGGTGIILAGTGIYIGGSQSVHAFHYITLVALLIILGFLLALRHQFKKTGPSTFINIASIGLVILNHLAYVYYIVASFIYY